MSSIIAINGGTLIDGNGGDPVKDSVLLVQDDRIIKVGRQDEVMIPPDARIIDASGKTVMPGLIESHSHPLGERGNQPGIWKYMDNIMNSPLLPYFKAVEVLRILIRKGITTIRILHPTIPSAPELKGEHLVALRTAVERGYFPSPRVLAAGPSPKPRMDRTGRTMGGPETSTRMPTSRRRRHQTPGTHRGRGHRTRRPQGSGDEL